MAWEMPNIIPGSCWKQHIRAISVIVIHTCCVFVASSKLWELALWLYFLVVILPVVHGLEFLLITICLKKKYIYICIYIFPHLWMSNSLAGYKNPCWLVTFSQHFARVPPCFLASFADVATNSFSFFGTKSYFLGYDFFFILTCFSVLLRYGDLDTS